MFSAQPDEPRIIKYFLRPIFLGSTLKSMSEMEDYLKESCTDIDYTVVRPPGLTNDPSSGKIHYSNSVKQQMQPLTHSLQ